MYSSPIQSTGCPEKMSPYTNYSSFVERALLYLWEFKIVSKPNSSTKMSNYRFIANPRKNALKCWTDNIAASIYRNKLHVNPKHNRSANRIPLGIFFVKGQLGETFVSTKTQAKTGRSEANVAAVRDSLEETRRGFSCRRNPVEVSKSTFSRITRLDLRWHPYRMRVRHVCQTTCHVDYAIRNSLMNAVETQTFSGASLLKTKQDLQWLEKLTLTMCANTHRRDNHRHLTSNAGIPVQSFLSGQHFAVVCGFGLLLFWPKCGRLCISSDAQRIRFSSTCHSFVK